MLFSVLSRGEIELFPNDVHLPHVIISITNPGSRLATLKTNEYTLGTLRLSFEDEEDDRASWDTRQLEGWERQYGPMRLFNREDAKAIRQLVEGTNPQAVIVHCEAGISRSAAVAAALAKHYNGSDQQFWLNVRYSPNKLVYKVLSEVMERGQ